MSLEFAEGDKESKKPSPTEKLGKSKTRGSVQITEVVSSLFYDIRPQTCLIHKKYLIRLEVPVAEREEELDRLFGDLEAGHSARPRHSHPRAEATA